MLPTGSTVHKAEYGTFCITLPSRQFCIPSNIKSTLFLSAWFDSFHKLYEAVYGKAYIIQLHRNREWAGTSISHTSTVLLRVRCIMLGPISIGILLSWKQNYSPLAEFVQNAPLISGKALERQTHFKLKAQKMILRWAIFGSQKNVRLNKIPSIQQVSGHGTLKRI
jgi:hypothetical protein